MARKSMDKSVDIWLIISELGIGTFLGIAFVKYSLEQDGLWSNDFLVGFIKFYLELSLIFFLAVIPIGIFGAIKLKRGNNILRAIIYSIIFWILSLIVSVILFNFVYIVSLIVILIGIIYGFNKGIQHELQNEDE